MPDNFWRKAFDEAAETPPPRVWDAIERRLDEPDSTKILPLWGTGLASSRPFVWSTRIAAAVALLLLGWWAVQTLPSANLSYKRNAPNVIAQHAEKPANTPASKEPTATEQADQANSSTELPESVASASKPTTESGTKTLAKSGRQQLSPFKPYPASALATLASKSRVPNSVGSELLMKTGQLAQARTAPRMSVTTAAAQASINSVVASQAVVTQTDGANPTVTIAFEPLSGRSLRLRGFGQIHRIVWFRPAEPELKPEIAQSKQRSRDAWASASVMPGSFNPMVSIKSASVASVGSASLDAIKASTTSQQNVSSSPNFSVAYQAGAGVQLSERWSIESGIGYLAGRSTLETPAQFSSASLSAGFIQNSASSNLYVDALRNSIHRGDLAYAVPQANYANVSNSAYQNSYNGQIRQVLTNDYQYMQVPVQVGYQLRPKKKLSLALLGGIITNIFIRNTVDSQLEITAKDGIYRPVSLAAAMGARFRYRPTRQWSASVAGMYQPSLGLGTQSESQVQSKPNTAGMSFGVDYHF
ncbi:MULTISPECIES: hypothetical protein [unclassified Spirosoma]|nr:MULTISPECIES: hypothetical protein [unclassified Spirosoma]